LHAHYSGGAVGSSISEPNFAVSYIINNFSFAHEVESPTSPTNAIDKIYYYSTFNIAPTQIQHDVSGDTLFMSAHSTTFLCDILRCFVRGNEIVSKSFGLMLTICSVS
jgi:hypothetical protein